MSFASGLAVVMFVGAARADATPEQHAKLKDAIKPLRDDALAPGDAYVATVLNVAEVMGPDWRPKGEWSEWITSILDGAAS